ncbi:MAG: extracellular solute-binding protein, partial [Anaerolineae bacterium]|nr:extracellular solute-binding protein [Anaerolineae bacterium]
LTQMISGTAPDILNGNDYCCYIWAERKQLVDLNPLVERDLTKEQISDFFDHHWQGLVYPGTGIRMGIANYAWVYQYYFNKDAFDQAGLSYPKTGWTVDDMSAALEALTKRDASGKVTRWGGGDAVYNAARIQLWLRIFGGYLVDPGDWTHCVLDSDESKQALEWHRHRIWDANSLVQSIQVADYQSLDNLALGTVAIQGECNGVLYSLLGEPPGFRWGTVAPPAGRNGQTITQGTIDSYMIWTGSKAKDIAWEFVKLLTVEDDFQLATSALWGCTPNRKSLLPRFVDAVRQEYPDVEDDQIQPQVDMLLDAQVTLRAQFKRQKASEELIAPVLEKIFIVGDTPVTAVGALAEEVTALNREQ